MQKRKKYLEKNEMLMQVMMFVADTVVCEQTCEDCQSSEEADKALKNTSSLGWMAHPPRNVLHLQRFDWVEILLKERNIREVEKWFLSQKQRGSCDV